jgi:3-oxoadipate enol-lactonase
VPLHLSFRAFRRATKPTVNPGVAAAFGPSFLPEARMVSVPGRGEVFCRVHDQPGSPMTLLLLHGWTASADVQWFSAYRALAERYSFVAIDHQGHGRGIRSLTPFSLAQCADDAAAAVRALGISSVVPVGYSMGGPISLQFATRHADLTAGIVVCATALDWNSTRRDRLDWMFLPVGETMFRSRLASASTALWARRIRDLDGQVDSDWLLAELRRNDPRALVEAGRELHRFDGLPLARSINQPAAMVITTKDRLVPPAKQQALAEALRASVVKVPIDHPGTITNGSEFSAALRQAVDTVADRLPLSRFETAG